MKNNFPHPKMITVTLYSSYYAGIWIYYFFLIQWNVIIDYWATAHLLAPNNINGARWWLSFVEWFAIFNLYLNQVKMLKQATDRTLCTQGFVIESWWQMIMSSKDIFSRYWEFPSNKFNTQSCLLINDRSICWPSLWWLQVSSSPPSV